MGSRVALRAVLLAMLTANSFSATRPVAFVAAHSFVAGITQPASVSIGDFNKDGKLDFVVTNSFNSVAVFLGKGNGTFQKPTIYTLTNYVIGGVAVADFNKDGKLDLAVIGEDAAGNGLALFTGNGDGSFAAPVYSRQGFGIHPVAADFNGDHSADIFVGGNGSSQILLGTGQGTFNDGQTQNITALDVAVGDFNGDGHLDVATTLPFNSAFEKPGISVLLGNGDGTFASPVTYFSGFSGFSGIATSDLNNDGKLDLAVTQYLSGYIEVLLGNGDGSFAPNIVGSRTGASPSSVAAGDFNQDGKMDLAVADFGGDGVTALAGKGDGTFSPPLDFPTGTKPAHLALGDFNNDGSLDVVVTNYGDNTVSVLLNAAGAYTKLRSSLNPSNVGQAVTFSVGITGSAPKASVPTGTILLKDGSTVLGRFPLRQGQASLSTTALARGRHTIRVQYSGNATFNPTSKVLVQTVR